MVNVALIVVAVLSIAIWIIIEVKRLKHKLFALLLIGLILFSYFGFVTSIKDKDIDLKSPSGVMKAGKVYMLWIVSISQNLKILTTNAIKLDWNPNQTIEDDDLHLNDFYE
jgi:hypothetical protein